MAISRMELSEKDKDILSIHQKGAQTNKKETGVNKDRVGSFIKELSNLIEDEEGWELEKDLVKSTKSLFKIKREDGKSLIIYVTLNIYIVPSTWDKFCQLKDTSEENKLCVRVDTSGMVNLKLYCIPQSKLDLYHPPKRPTLSFTELEKDFDEFNNYLKKEITGSIKPWDDEFQTAAKLFWEEINRWE